MGKKYAKACAAQTYHSVNVGDREVFYCHWRHSCAIAGPCENPSQKEALTIHQADDCADLSAYRWSDRSTLAKSGPHTHLALIKNSGCIALLPEGGDSRDFRAFMFANPRQFKSS